ncbi:3'-5' exonuclease [Aeromonas sp. 3925]|uniref:3'-5' exonuclease n=1 Tax=Aeromonas genomosp. paramedia TaxID=3086176 RepID=UPI001FFD6B9D|nr:3'-5' exonuclease [Aeromonas genomosp. paramedia]MCK2086410.1 3'-5' exonuclease [Aeromonas genomosp. paramedia]
MSIASANTVVVLDFETTGLSPGQGDRAIEIGAVRIKDGHISERFSALMNPGFKVSSFIEQYTGISNAMLKQAPPCHEVMADFVDFIGDDNLVAHNASFDKRFLDAEVEWLPARYRGQFACSLLLSRRLFPDAPDHKLGTLVQYKRLPNDGVFHRALADAEVTAHLWLALLEELACRYGIIDPDFEWLLTLGKKPKQVIPSFLREYAARK